VVYCDTSGYSSDLSNQYQRKSDGNESIEGTSKTFTFSEKYVGEIANVIESKFPGIVVDVNKDVYRPYGTKLTDFDIELDNVVIQVKSGGGKGLTSQLLKTL